MDPIDPFDQVKLEKSPDDKIDKIHKIYKGTFSLFKLSIIFIIFLFIIIYLYYLFNWVYFVDEGIIIQPFEISGVKNVSGTIVADFLGFELNRILETNRMQQENVISTMPRQKTAISVEGYKDKFEINLPPPLINENYGLCDLSQDNISSRPSSINDNIAQIGSVGMGGSSLSLGQVLLSFKGLAGQQPSTITGSLQRYGPIISIVAVWNDRDSPMRLTREARLTLDRGNESVEDQILALISDLAYQIAFEMLKRQPHSKEAYPRTWQGFKYLIQAEDAYSDYAMTGNTSNLETAKDTMTSIRHSEPGCIGSIEFRLIHNLSSAYLELGRIIEAERLYKNLSDLRPFESNLSLGLIYDMQNQKEDTLDAFDNATKINPKSLEAWNNKGNALGDQGRYGEAIQAYDEAIRLDPNNASLVWNNKGSILHAQGKYDGAIQAYDEAIQLDPNSALIWNNKGLALYFQKKYDEAVQAYDEAIMLDPSNADYWNNKGIALRKHGKYNEAVQAYDEAIRLDPNDRFWNNKGIALKMLGSTLEANAAFAKAKELGYTG